MNYKEKLSTPLFVLPFFSKLSNFFPFFLSSHFLGNGIVSLQYTEIAIPLLLRHGTCLLH